MTFLENSVRYIFWLIDSLIYWINTVLFELFTLIAETRFDDTFFEVFYQRVYAILGIFVLFRVAFSLIQMLINPDLINDKQKSPGKIAMRVVVSLMLIIAVPSIFSFAYRVQSAVLGEQIIGKIILGNTITNDNGNTANKSVVEQGKFMAWQIFRGFLNVDAKFVDYDESTGKITPKSNVSSKTQKCIDNLNEAGSMNSDPFNKIMEDGCLHQKDSNVYVYNYKWIISTIATIFVAWMLIGFCLDVGIRVIKLGFLQLIAPVPISSYILGDKDSAFSKWTKSCLMTYLEVFIRLMIIYFVIFIISAIFTSGDLRIPQTSFVMAGLVKIVVAIGLLVFAKQAPDLIKDMFGIKGDANSFSLNPMSRINSSPLAKLAIGGAAAGAAGAVGNFTASRQAGRNIAQSIGSGLGGVFTGGARGMAAGAKAQTGAFAAGLTAGGIGGQHILNNQGTSFLGRTAARAQSAIGMQTQAQRQDKQIEAYNKYADLRKNIKDVAEGNKTKRMFFDNGRGGYVSFAMNADGSTSSAAQNYMRDHGVAPGQVLSADDFNKSLQNAIDSGASEAEITRRREMFDNAVNAVIDEDVSNSSTSIGAMFNESLRIINENSNDEVFANMDTSASASALGKNFGAAKEATTVLKSSEAYQAAHRTQDAIKGNNKK